MGNLSLSQRELRLCPVCTDREEVWREVSSVVDASVHGDEPLDRGLVLDTGVVETSVQHDDGIGEDIGCV